MNSQAAYNCFLCNRAILGKLGNWKGHPVHEECAQRQLAGHTVPANEDPGCQPFTCGRVFSTGEICILEQNHSGPCSYTETITETFRRRLRDDPDVHMLNLARTLNLDGFTWCRVATEIIGRINRAEKKLEEIGYRRDGEHWLPVRSFPEPFETDGPAAPDYIVKTSSEGWVKMKMPGELLGMDCPDAGPILKEVQAVAELLLTKNRAYGSSFRQGPKVFSRLSPVEAINARMDDKIARMQQAKDFSEDTELDLMGYLILKRVLLREQEKTPQAGGDAPCPSVSHVTKSQCGLPQGHGGLHLSKGAVWSDSSVGPAAPTGGIPGHKDEPGPPCPPDRLPNGKKKCPKLDQYGGQLCKLAEGHPGMCSNGEAVWLARPEEGKDLRREQEQTPQVATASIDSGRGGAKDGMSPRVPLCGVPAALDPAAVCDLPSGHTGGHRFNYPTAWKPDERGNISLADTASCTPAPGPSSPARPAGPESAPAPSHGSP